MYFLHIPLWKDRLCSYASSSFVVSLFIIFVFPIKLMSNGILVDDFLSQVEYALIENDTAQAELILHYLMKEKPKSKVAKISMLRLLSIKSQAINKEDVYWEKGKEEAFLFLKILQTEQVWKEKKETFLKHISDVTIVNDQNIMESFNELNEIVFVKQKTSSHILNKEIAFLQQLIKEALEFYQGALKPNLSSKTNQHLALELICFLQKETISRLFWADFLKEDFFDNPFYFEYQKCINLLELKTIKASFFAKQFSLNPTLSTQQQLADAYDVIFFIQNQICRKGLFNEQRKEYVRNKFNVQEDAIIFYYNQYQITEKQKWMDKILLTMENIKSSMLETKRMYYDSKNLLKDLCRKVISEIEKVGSSTVIFETNNNDLVYIHKQIKKSNYYKSFYNIHEHSEKEANKVDLLKLKNICRKTKKESLAIINCFESENYLFVLMIEKESEILNIVHKLNSDSIQSTLQYLKKTFSNPVIALEATKSSVLQFEQASALVYQSILKPLFEKRKPDHIVVVPDGILNYIPFEVLVVDGGNRDDQGVSYLLHSTAVRYYPSLKLFSKYESKDEKTVSIKQLVTIAPDYKVSRSMNKKEKELPMLSGARIETEKIERLFPLKVVKQNAFKNKNNKLMENSNQLLHLAMHASSEYEQNKGPVLIGSNKKEEHIFLYDIASLPKVPPVVILSACETGHGKYTSGEGLKSIGQQFLQSGTKCTIQNLNKIEDGTSSELVMGFYKELKRNRESHRALQKSKIEFLKNADAFHAHPYFWSCLISYGQSFKIN